MTYAIEVRLCATKFHKDRFNHSKVDKRGYTDTQTAWKSCKPLPSNDRRGYTYIHTD
jgi:hypothetical protein